MFTGHNASTHEGHLRHAPVLGQLFIDGREVGEVELLSRDGHWRFGRFHPRPGFSRFARIFGRWSLMMHVDGDSRRLSREAARELRAVENAIDLLHAAMKLDNGVEREIRELNIDGPLIEWWEP